DTATLAVVNTADGSVADVRRQPLPEDNESVAELVEMVKGAEEMEAHPEGEFVVGSGVDIALIKPALEAATTLPVSAPAEPTMPVAPGAALASANAPIFAPSPASLAQAGGNATNYALPSTSLVRSDTATLAVVNTADGSVADVRQRFLPEDD